MYCANCGVKLADTEKKCPLCGVTAYHPEIERPDAQPLYPTGRRPAAQVSSWGLQIILTVLFIVPMFVILPVDLYINRAVTWSGYVVGALGVCYISFVLPVWFHRPNPVIFVPCVFAAVALYLLYINLATGGSWFLRFALPVVGVLGLNVTAVVTLLRYVPKGSLYILGGAIMAMGAFMPLMGFLLNLTFFEPAFALWSLYPMAVLILLGGTLLFLAICRPAREMMERKFFI